MKTLACSRLGLQARLFGGQIRELVSQSGREGAGGYSHIVTQEKGSLVRRVASSVIVRG